MPKQAGNSVQAFKANNRWISDNQKLLKQKYGDQWVAVLNQAVIDNDDDLRQLINRLKEAHIDVYTEIAVEYIPDDEQEMVPPVFSGPQP
jgi:ribosomal protein L20